MSTTAANTTTFTATLDAALAVFIATLPAKTRWAVEGWAAHLRLSRHANHAANSLAKHQREFQGELGIVALHLTVARMVDHGMTSDEARTLVMLRAEARRARELDASAAA